MCYGQVIGEAKAKARKMGWRVCKVRVVPVDHKDTASGRAKG